MKNRLTHLLYKWSSKNITHEPFSLNNLKTFYLSGLELKKSWKCVMNKYNFNMKLILICNYLENNTNTRNPISPKLGQIV